MKKTLNQLTTNILTLSIAFFKTQQLVLITY